MKKTGKVEAVKKLSGAIDADLVRRFKIECAKRRLRMRDALSEAVQVWLRLRD